MRGKTLHKAIRANQDRTCGGPIQSIGWWAKIHLLAVEIFSGEFTVCGLIGLPCAAPDASRVAPAAGDDEDFELEILKFSESPIQALLPAQIPQNSAAARPPKMSYVLVVTFYQGLVF